MAGSETDLYNEIMRAHSRGGVRLFRFNSGTAWQGKIVEHTLERMVMLYPKPIKLAPVGFPDLAGWSPRIITAEDIGMTIAQFTGIEGKGLRTRTTPEQIAFRDLVLRSGGRAGIARSVEDARHIIAGSENISIK